MKNKLKTYQDKELENILVKGEKILLKGNIHAAFYWKVVAILIFSFLLFLLVKPLGILIFVVGLIMLFIALLTKYYLMLVITNKRILVRYGLLQMEVIDIRLSKVESIDLERMLPGHIFGYASVVIMGTGNRLIRIPYIQNAHNFRRFYNEMVLANEGNEEAEKEIENIKTNN